MANNLLGIDRKFESSSPSFSDGGGDKSRAMALDQGFTFEFQVHWEWPGGWTAKKAHEADKARPRLAALRSY
jgi:hypothetical protein